MGNTCQSEEPHPELKEVNREQFNPFFQSQPAQENQHQILSHFTFVSNYEDKFLGRCSVISQKSTQNLFLCKEFRFNNDEECQQKYQQLLKRKDNYQQCEEIIRIKQVFIKNVEGFFKDSKKIMLIVQYPLINLRKEFNNRMINRLEFSKQEITSILFSCIKGYAAVERAGSKNDKIRLAHIFVGVQHKQSMIKVIDSDMLPSLTNLQIIKNFSHKNMLNHDIYLSPEQFENYTFNGLKGATHKTSGVYSLGKTILDLCLMDSSQVLYHYTDKYISQQQVFNMIRITGKKHGSIIEKFLIDMLEFNPEKRLSFQQLQRKIPNLLSQNGALQSRMSSSKMSNTLRFSTIKNQRSDIVLNQTKSLRNSRFSSVSNLSMSKSVGVNRSFVGNIKVQKQEEDDLEKIHEEYTNGNSFIGLKKKGQKHGKGKYIFKDGSYYDGNWKNNKIEGKGSLFYSNGKIEYSGEWHNDQFDGWGTYSSSEERPLSWNKYQGEFKKGQIQGRGKMYFKNGIIFEGQFRNGRIFGKGRRIQSNGNVIEKQWEITSPDDFSNIAGL